ncbi:MAG: hypothetical protein IPJ89_00280 [Candidatus Iainarchaeum archaeon]|uniref:Uncharacterized protein n=1 Tax=Candidatus Iainarchaeum sp. TaxID=3101447 RepID=A0A7T9DK10_9ARCH|nr:MAG: hypothetical protein IPJ89_00280 [Candidatus Diapherotrites archaeon]
MAPPTPRKPRFVRMRRLTKRVWNSRTKKWILVAAVATALGVGGREAWKRTHPPKNGKPPAVRVMPLHANELWKYTVKDLQAEHLVDVIGGKHHAILGNHLPPAKREEFVRSVARQWVEALDGKPDAQDPKGRLRGFPEISAKTVVTLSEMATQLSPDLSPREVAGYLDAVPRLFDACKRANGGSAGPARAFWKDPTLLRTIRRNTPDARVLVFFDALERNGHRDAISDIYRALGL